MEFGAVFWIFLLAYFGFFAWQAWQRQRTRRQMLESLRVGDEVVTAGGMLGEIRALRGERVELEVGPDMRLWVLRGAVTGRAPAVAVEATEEPADLR